MGFTDAPNKKTLKFKMNSKVFGNEPLVGFELLNQVIAGLETPTLLTSIIDADMYLFGVIYTIVFAGKEIDTTKKDELHEKINEKVREYKSDYSYILVISIFIATSFSDKKISFQFRKLVGGDYAMVPFNLPIP